MHQLTVVRTPRGFHRYDLVRSFLQLRKEVFIDKMDWPLYQYDAIEFEQYDTFNAVYIIAHEGAHVVGGVRLIRTDHEIGTGKIKYSYMIRDAYNGHLPGMPTDICFEKPPTDQKIWELTRLATLPGADVARDLLHAANHFLVKEGAERCLFLGPPAFLRMAKSMGFVPARLGPTVRNEDGAFLAFSCDVVDFSRKQDFDYVDLGAEST
jgi:acyl homoserine lactone synthase